MSATQPPKPIIKNPGTKPTTSRMLFVNIPVTDVQRSITFFESLGFVFNPQFTDVTAAAMLVGQEAFMMLLNHERFQGFSKRPMGDPHKETNVLLTISAESREAVDALVAKAVVAGGAQAHEPEDHGFMYESGFYDLDGHAWGVFWMDPSFVQQ